MEYRIPAVHPSYYFITTATNGIAPNATQTFTLFVNNPPPAITSADNTTFVVGTFGKLSPSGLSPHLTRVQQSASPAHCPSGINFHSEWRRHRHYRRNRASWNLKVVTQSDITASNGTLPDATQNFTITVPDAPPVLEAPPSPVMLLGLIYRWNCWDFYYHYYRQPHSDPNFGRRAAGLAVIVDNTDGTATSVARPIPAAISPTALLLPRATAFHRWPLKISLSTSPPRRPTRSS